MTGAAGFIGAHISARLESEGHECIFIDRLSDYYSTDLKIARFENLVKGKLKRFEIHDPKLRDLFRVSEFDCVVHLAAQPGVRVKFPSSLSYFKDNIEAFSIISRLAIEAGVKKVIYASSSSVYEKAQKIPFSEDEILETPVNLYPFSKWTNENMANSFSRVSDTKFTGLRFFSVYGPWGRPDMAYFRLIAAAYGQYQFTLNGDGLVKRDFTYVDDVIDRINFLVNTNKSAPEVLNVGGGNEISILQLVNIVQNKVGGKLNYKNGNADGADIAITRSDSRKFDALTGDMPFTQIEEGMSKTINWYNDASSRFNVKNWLQ